jgi:hypothetical protein
MVCPFERVRESLIVFCDRIFLFVNMKMEKIFYFLVEFWADWGDKEPGGPDPT